MTSCARLLPIVIVLGSVLTYGAEEPSQSEDHVEAHFQRDLEAAIAEHPLESCVIAVLIAHKRDPTPFQEASYPLESLASAKTVLEKVGDLHTIYLTNASLDLLANQGLPAILKVRNNEPSGPEYALVLRANPEAFVLLEPPDEPKWVRSKEIQSIWDGEVLLSFSTRPNLLQQLRYSKTLRLGLTALVVAALGSTLHFCFLRTRPG